MGKTEKKKTIAKKTPGNGKAASISGIINHIHKSYSEHEEMNNLEGAILPSRATISEMAEVFMSLIFPGFYTREFMDSRDAKKYIRNKCEKLQKLLELEIEKGVRYNCRIRREDCKDNECLQAAKLVTRELLESIPEIRDLAHADAHAAFDTDPAAQNLFEVVLSYPGVAALTIHRFAHFLYQRGVPFIPRMLSEYIHGKTGIDINPGAKIGRGVAIDHGTGVVIGETAVVGNSVRLYQGVTLGALSVLKKQENGKRHPTIEDEVTIYAGATILGGDTVVGRGSVIGGNVWLVQSVPPNSKIYIESPRLVCKNCNLDFGCGKKVTKEKCSKMEFE